MAKVSGPWLRGAKKKLAGVVLQKGGSGETIAREWVKPKNPQTQKQMAQRIIFATVAQAAKFMAPIVNHSFEGVEYGEKSLQRFKQLNLRRLRELASWDYDHSPAPANAKSFMTTRRISALIPNSYIVSDGSLPEAPFDYEVDSELKTCPLDVTLKLVENSEVEGGGIYIFDYLDAQFGLVPGGQLTICVICSSEENRFVYSNTPGAVIPYTDFFAVRLVMKPDAVNKWVQITDGGGSEVEFDLLSEVKQCLDTQKSNIAFIDRLYTVCDDGVTTENNYLYQTWGFSSVTNLMRDITGGANALAACWINSQPNGNSWLRSKEVMVCAKPSVDINFGLTWDIALDAWFRGEVVAESNRFLNEGGTVNEIE